MSEMRPTPELISLVIPLYNEEKIVPKLKSRLSQFALMLKLPVEFILVNDGSRDATAPLVREWCAKDPRVKFVDLSRNFGHQAAVTAGLDFAAGDVVVIMDGDLQDPPELILEMLDEYRMGFDVVYAQRIRRHGETFFKLVTAQLFYRFMRRFVHADLPENTGDFRLMSRPVVEALSHLREGHRFLRGMVTWLGFKQTSVKFDRPERPAGETKFPLRKMLRFAWDAVLSFSSIPLRMASAMGIVVIFSGLTLGGWSVYRKLVYDDLVQGWPTLVVLNCVIGGTILICVGVMGEYVGRIFEELKQRPLYIVRDLINVSPTNLPRRGVAPLAHPPRRIPTEGLVARDSFESNRDFELPS
jgi:glycosyltransferase involved in cell wall biosynthesis